MSKRFGNVIDVDGKEALVSIQTHSSCDKCGACKGGSTKSQDTIWVLNDHEAKQGDFVQIELRDRQLLKISFLVYIVPVLALLIGLFIGQLAADAYEVSENVMGLVFGLGFMGLSFIGLRILDDKLDNSQAFKGKIIENLSKSSGD